MVDREPTMQELQAQENARIEQATKEALLYVENNIFSAMPGDRCGDDRSMEEGLLSIFGGSTGWVVALMAEGVSPETSRNVIMGINRNEGADFEYYFHGDGHGHLCGFEGLTSGEHAEEYGVTQENMQVVKKENEMDLNNGKAHKEIYQGEHGAVRVLRAHGGDHTVRSNDGNEKNFVVDVDRIKEKAQKVAHEAGVDAEKLFERILKHTNRTAAYLAEGKDIFDVYIDEEGKFRVEYGGKVLTLQEYEEQKVA